MLRRNVLDLLSHLSPRKISRYLYWYNFFSIHYFRFYFRIKVVCIADSNALTGLISDRELLGGKHLILGAVKVLYQYINLSGLFCLSLLLFLRWVSLHLGISYKLIVHKLFLIKINHIQLHCLWIKKYMYISALLFPIYPKKST